MTATADVDLDSRAETLRHTLVDQLMADGRITTTAVEAAFRAVPRHAFAPEVDLDASYADDTVKTKFDETGTCLSSLSAPWLQALMIEQAALQSGDRVLEIGSGGYQAALLAEVVGRTGRVVTLDIDPDITNRAAIGLERTGHSRVTVALGDGENGWAVDAPYAAIIVCAQAYDIPPAWTAQLAPGGRLVVPLSIRGQNRTLTLVANGDQLRATNSIFSGFVPFQGIGGLASRRTAVQLAGSTTPLNFMHSEPDDPVALAQALDHPGVQVWSGVTVPGMYYIGDLQMYLAIRLAGGCTGGDTEALIPDAVRRFPPTWTSGGNLGYLASKKIGEDYALGSIAYGPDAQRHAKQLVELIEGWDREVRGGPGMTVTICPRDTADSDLPDGHVIDTVHRRIVIAFPATGTDTASRAVQA
ncbi:protein-L-isoaspartate(D-aspartate)O-methyltransferase [Catenulispora acidiphila DSM 44928]|uniref:Protein-L-isoaspartate O-methyltransferase n=1 Tax=Catenulispora acidiphila (strain DSM 44928 / JCM 14897 / NBRC 102108 / NRRL B-24433 / ID139908) TaxID=479433 RepID=C7Q408_CATAD|nr:methyltransferase, FxLD system [Catenulispora acidiphila]ACU77766.1 protein-L-isoaspartate(D-aspartate)O-methyltransferase [Catenulispora acidiphila DSM 44928]